MYAPPRKITRGCIGGGVRAAYVRHTSRGGTTPRTAQGHVCMRCAVDRTLIAPANLASTFFR